MISISSTPVAGAAVTLHAVLSPAIAPACAATPAAGRSPYPELLLLWCVQRSAVIRCCLSCCCCCCCCTSRCCCCLQPSKGCLGLRQLLPQGCNLAVAAAAGTCAGRMRCRRQRRLLFLLLLQPPPVSEQAGVLAATVVLLRLRHCEWLSALLPARLLG
jgi:hypothetical protein